MWGTATSSHQVEGNNTNNDWYVFEQTKGRIYQDQMNGLACDWWEHAERDFERIAEMHQNTHRLSIEWSRIEPEPGVWDEYALARYRDMVEGLVKRGVKPMVTLHHFTNPIWLSERGGWENDASIGYFDRYVRKVVKAIGGLTDLWCTVNEPAVLVGQGYGLGRFPPAHNDMNAGLQAALNIVKAHATAYETIHELQPIAQVGLAKHMMIWKAWRTWFPNDVVVTNMVQHLFNDMALQMVTEGIMRVPGRKSILLRKAAHTLDWLGVNYYQRYRLRFNISAGKTFFVEQMTAPYQWKGPGEWGEIHPDGMLYTLRRLWRHYKLPMYITENGIPDETDEHRPRFIVSHLQQVWQAMQQGIPVNGYYFWSLLDNYEWTEAYDPRFRFGLIGVDFDTQERCIKQSGKLYAAICQQGRISEQILEEFVPELLLK